MAVSQTIQLRRTIAHTDLAVLGGYSLSSSPAHWEWLNDLQKELSKSISFSVVVPAYTLAPEGQYPLQLKQAVETLERLLKQGKKPGDVSAIIGLIEKR
jgi:acetyl esterase/lipase